MRPQSSCFDSFTPQGDGKILLLLPLTYGQLYIGKNTAPAIAIARLKIFLVKL
jgi:hypothetical protein